MMKVCSRCDKKFEKNKIPLNQGDSCLLKKSDFFNGKFRKLCDSCLLKARKSRKNQRLKVIMEAIDDYENKMDKLFRELRNKIYEG